MLLEADSVELIDFGDHGGDASLTGLDSHIPIMTDSNSGMAPSGSCTLGEPTRVNS